MNGILDTILAHKQAEVLALKARGGVSGTRPDARVSFSGALRKADGLAVIAEVKQASPSKGLICSNFDPVRIAQAYEQGGAAAISVLTDERFFMGSLDYLVAVRKAVSIPVLRKDFIIDEIQILEAAQAGADAVLLIAVALTQPRLEALYACALASDIEALIEVHDEDEMARVAGLSPAVSMVGVNNRNLSTFVTDIGTTVRLAPAVPASALLISESGIENGEQTAVLRAAGVRAVLVGESLVNLADPSLRIRELTHAGTR